MVERIEMSTSSQEKIEDLRKRYPGAEVFRFGDGPQLCAELLALVISGKKTATCGALRDFEAGGEAMPHVGRHDIALHWTGEPAVVIETKSIEQRRFCDVTEAFALAEGENDSLEGWRQDHETYFARNGGFDPEMVLVCERFEVVEVVNA